MAALTRLAISNIAWRQDEDRDILPRLVGWGATGIEVAPTRLWTDPLHSPRDDRRRLRQEYEQRGLPIVAMQSLLFGQPALTLFESEGRRRDLLDYLTGMIRLAADLGAGVLVFGSPKNRRRGDLPPAEATPIAENFFREIGRRAADHGAVFCIEPNPPEYGCDFIHTASEAFALAQAVNSPGFGVHLDAAAMTWVKDPLPATMHSVRHFHISEKELAPIGSGIVDHAAFAAGLRERQFGGWRSIEMRPGSGDNRPAVQKALDLGRSIYG